MNKDVIYSIAKQCREISEVFVGSISAHGFDFFDTSSKRDLACFCACASWFLAKKLNHNGIDAKVIIGNVDDETDNHCWVEVEGYIVDITATQFSFGRNKPIIIALYNEYENHYEKNRIVESIEIHRQWPEGQRPNEQIIKKLEKMYEKG